MTRSPSLRELRAHVPEHLCIACEQPLPKARTKPNRMVCRERDCVRFYRRIWCIDRLVGALDRINKTLSTR